MQIQLEFYNGSKSKVEATCFAEARITRTGLIIVEQADSVGMIRDGFKGSIYASKKDPMKFSPTGFKKGYTGFGSGSWRVSAESLKAISELPKKEVKELPIKEFPVVVFVKAKTISGAKSAIKEYLGFDTRFSFNDCAKIA